MSPTLQHNIRAGLDSGILDAFVSTLLTREGECRANYNESPRAYTRLEHVEDVCLGTSGCRATWTPTANASRKATAGSKSRSRTRANVLNP